MIPLVLDGTESIRQDMERMDKLKKDGSELYDDTHANSFYLDVNNFRTSKVEDALNMSSPTYQDYYDVSKEEQELIKNFKPKKATISSIIDQTKVYKESVVNRELPSLHAESLEITLTVPLSR